MAGNYIFQSRGERNAANEETARYLFSDERRKQMEINGQRSDAAHRCAAPVLALLDVTRALKSVTDYKRILIY